MAPSDALLIVAQRGGQRIEVVHDLLLLQWDPQRQLVRVDAEAESDARRAHVKPRWIGQVRVPARHDGSPVPVGPAPRARSDRIIGIQVANPAEGSRPYVRRDRLRGWTEPELK